MKNMLYYIDSYYVVAKSLGKLYLKWANCVLIFVIHILESRKNDKK